MKLKNSTSWSDAFLRRMVSWCCKQLKMPLRAVYSAEFRQRRKNRFSGHAYYNGGKGRFVASIAPDGFYPWTDNGKSPGIIGIARTLNDRLECLINITAHELRHIQADVDNEKSRGSAKRLGWNGSSERVTEIDAQKVLATFRENRDALLAEWNRLPVGVAKAKPTIQEQRFAKVQAALDRWQRKAKLAATKIKKYKRQARYYEQAIAATKGKQ